MNCETLDNLLLDLLYDEVEGDDKRQAQAHLNGCEGCQQKFAGMGGVRQMFQAMPEPELPALSYQALLAEANTAAKKYAQGLASPNKKETESFWAKFSAGMRILWSPPVAVAVGVVLVLGVSLSLNTQHEAAQTPVVATEPMPASIVIDTPTRIEAAIAPSSTIAPAIPVAFSPEENIPKIELATEADETLAKARLEAPRGMFGGKLAEEAPSNNKAQGEGVGAGDIDGSFGVDSAAIPGNASAELFTVQTMALAAEGKCPEAEKTARAISAGTASWCQSMQASAKCFEQSKHGEQTKALYNEMKSFDSCAAEAEKALAALNKSQVGGTDTGTKSTIRSDLKKKAKPDPAPKAADKENVLDPFKKNISF
jgi:hypothetical protein